MPASSPQRHPLSRLLSYAREYRRRVMLATTFSILNKIWDLAPPALIGTAVDIVVQQENSFIAQLGVKKYPTSCGCWSD